MTKTWYFFYQSYQSVAVVCHVFAIQWEFQNVRDIDFRPNVGDFFECVLCLVTVYLLNSFSHVKENMN